VDRFNGLAPLLKRRPKRLAEKARVPQPILPRRRHAETSKLAEGVGFEPTGLLTRRFSRPLHSAALPPFQHHNHSWPIQGFAATFSRSFAARSVTPMLTSNQCDQTRAPDRSLETRDFASPVARLD
jgi:hypothetical protein